VIENFRPGVMDRLGLGHRPMLADNRRLVYCSLPGFGKDDSRAAVAAYEGVVSAAAGLYSVSSAPPVYTGLPMASTFAAIIGAASMSAAWFARERSGAGQWIECALYDALFEPLVVALLHNGATEKGPVYAAVMDQFWPLAACSPFRGQYQCADGRWIDMTVHSARTMKAFLDAADKHDWVRDGLIGEDFGVRSEHIGALNKLVRDVFRTRPAKDWETDLADRSVAVSGVYAADEWLAHPQARASHALMEVGAQSQATTQPGRVVRVSGATPPIALSSQSDGRAILEEWTLRALAPTHEQTTGKPPLDGVRVLDVSMLLAGPQSGRMLAELGADVVKICEPTGMHGGIGSFADRDRGKRSIILDLKTPAGLEIFWALVDQCDVILTNFRPGVAERLGISYEQARARKREIIYASDSAFGEEGPLASRGGYEYQAQALAGLETRFGGDGAPCVQPVPVVDIGTGCALTFGVIIALLRKHRTGEGAHILTSLAMTATMHSALYLLGEGAEPRGQECKGSGVLHRIWQSADGWVFVGCAPAQADALARIVGAPDGEWETRFRQRSTGQWVDQLRGAGIGAAPCQSVSQVLKDEEAIARDLFYATFVANMGPTVTNNPAPRFSRTPLLRNLPTTEPGQHAGEILRRVGKEDRLQRLIDDHVITPNFGGPFAF
jgi:crotonobetainyl-CoA:carnitine CoA-transferase CaiB-like acyl-CoA transferase